MCIPRGRSTGGAELPTFCCLCCLWLTPASCVAASHSQSPLVSGETCCHHLSQLSMAPHPAAFCSYSLCTGRVEQGPVCHYHSWPSLVPHEAAPCSWSPQAGASRGNSQPIVAAVPGWPGHRGSSRAAPALLQLGTVGSSWVGCQAWLGTAAQQMSLPFLHLPPSHTLLGVLCGPEESRCISPACFPPTQGKAAVPVSPGHTLFFKSQICLLPVMVHLGVFENPVYHWDYYT